MYLKILQHSKTNIFLKGDISILYFINLNIFIQLTCSKHTHKFFPPKDVSSLLMGVINDDKIAKLLS